MEAQQTSTYDLVAFLRATPLFANVDSAILQEIAPELEPIECDAGEILIHEGAPGDGLYLVQRGRLRAVSHGQDGAEVFLNDIEAGEGVGEVALLTGERRTATVYTATAAKLVRLSREQFERLGRHHPEAMQAISQAIVRRLQQTQLNLALHVGKLFAQLDEPILRALQADLELTLLRGGEILVRQGDTSDALYVVVNGRLRVVLEKDDGSTSILEELRRGQMVGQIGILTHGRRAATVYAVRDSLLARLSQAGFERLLAAYPPAIIQQFVKPIITQLRDQANHGRQIDRDITTVAVVPITADVPISAFTAQLAGALAASGPTLHLTSAGLDEALAKPGIAQTPPDAPTNITIVRWLNEQESSYRYILYQADPAASHWTERCLRQADRILLVGDAGGSPEQSAIERALLPEDNVQIAAQRNLVLLHPPDTEHPSGTRRWLEARQLSNHYHVRRDNTVDIARLARLLTGRGVGVVLSGGGAAGYGHIGAIRALRAAGIPIDLLGGTSAGAMLACQYAMGWDHDMIMSKNRTAVRHRFDYTFPITALMNGAEFTAMFQEMFGDAQLEDMWIHCFCVTANLSRATMMVHERGPAWKYTRASASVPGVVPPVFDGGEMLVDGGLLNNLPTDIMHQRSDCGVIIAIDASGTNDPLHDEHVPYETSLSGWKVLWRRLNPFAQTLRVPTMGQIMLRVAVLNDTQHVKTSRDLADYYMRLAVEQYGMLEFHALEQIVVAGYESAQELLAVWKDDEQFRALQSAGRAG
jgi:predicted acylesterase/phospholipase RssA/CRP-like cAMP-binding protein